MVFVVAEFLRGIGPSAVSSAGLVVAACHLKTSWSNMSSETTPAEWVPNVTEACQRTCTHRKPSDADCKRTVCINATVGGFVW